LWEHEFPEAATKAYYDPRKYQEWEIAIVWPIFLMDGNLGLKFRQIVGPAFSACHMPLPTHVLRAVYPQYLKRAMKTFLVRAYLTGAALFVIHVTNGCARNRAE
jgi:hypothetical protein